MTIVNHGYKQVPTGKVIAPGDIERVRKEQHTIDLGRSFDSTGGKPADPIILEYGTGKLLGGKHRFAAALNKRLPVVWALLLEGTPEELEHACLVEQIRRRQPTDAEIARLVELEHPTPAQTFPDVEDDAEEEPRGPGRPSTGKREAIERVAALTGRTPAAVKQAEYRERKKDASPDEYSTEAPSRCLDWFDLPADEEVEAHAQLEHSFLEGIEKTLVKLQGDCTRHAADYPHVKQDLHCAAVSCRQQKPNTVCPHCKLTKMRSACLACRGRGWLRACEVTSIPLPLLARGPEAGVFVAGKFTLLTEVK
jgi:hypothetical protein